MTDPPAQESGRCHGERTPSRPCASRSTADGAHAVGHGRRADLGAHGDNGNEFVASVDISDPTEKTKADQVIEVIPKRWPRT